MKKLYAYMLYGLLGIEVLVFAVLYVRGPQGLQSLATMHAEQKNLSEGVEHLRHEVADLKSGIENWQQHPFHKEKIAREQLQMARPDDEVFYLT